MLFHHAAGTSHGVCCCARTQATGVYAGSRVACSHVLLHCVPRVCHVGRGNAGYTGFHEECDCGGREGSEEVWARGEGAVRGVEGVERWRDGEGEGMVFWLWN